MNEFKNSGRYSANIAGALLLSILVACGGQDDDATQSDEWPVDPASGLRVPSLGPVPSLPDWADNPVTPEKRKLGRALLFDPRLSSSGRVGCVTCHTPNTWFQAGLPLDSPDRSYPEGVPLLPRNTPSLLNLAYAPVFRADGSHGSDLYGQLTLPFAEANMNLTPGIPAEDVHTVDEGLAKVELRRKLTEEATGYIDWYQDAFGQDIRMLSDEDVWLLTGKALGIFIREVVSRDAPFDRWNAGDDTAMDDSAVRGLELFVGKAGCVGCHYGPMFTDYAFHNLSLELPDETGRRDDEGRAIVTEDDADRGAFLTPSLRSATKTSPYFHDGSVVSLRRVIEHKTDGAALVDPLHSPLLEVAEPLDDDEVSDLIRFLEALTGAALPANVTEPPDQLP